MLLSVTGVRGGIVKYMPKSIAMASSGAWGAGAGYDVRAGAGRCISSCFGLAGLSWCEQAVLLCAFAPITCT